MVGGRGRARVVPVGPANDKRTLRAEMRTVRATIAADPADRAARSSLIAARVVDALSARTVERLMVFDALAGEPDLAALVRWASDRSVDVFVPEVDGPDLRVAPGDVDPTVLDAVIVPGLAFTRAGDRLGQGGGHFDRFLPRLAAGCLRIGVAFREQLVPHLPVEAHDVRLDAVVTDERSAGPGGAPT